MAPGGDAEDLKMPVPQASISAEPAHLRVDSTGLRLCGSGEWLVEKRGTRTRPSRRKLHTGVDAGTGQILAAMLATNDVDGGSQVGPTVTVMCGRPPLRKGKRCC